MLSRYCLKNRDKIILEFEAFKNESGAFGGQKINIIKQYEEFDDVLDGRDLEKWIERREVPENREFADEIIATYSDAKSSIFDFIDKTLALSLNDTFWIVPKNKMYKWCDYNLYDNDFNEVISSVAFTGKSDKVDGLILSPEFTTNGMLKKCWQKDKDGKICLYKGSSKEYANGSKEAFSEYYMCQIAKTLGFRAVVYELKKFHNEVVSCCEIFTSEDFGYKPMYYCIDKDKRDLSFEKIEDEILSIYGAKTYADMMLFDAIIYNSDRHFGNFGMMVENVSGDFVKQSPIFDNGFSLINSLTQDELKNIKEAMSEKCSYSGYDFDEQAKRYAQPRHIKNLQNLQNFKFKRHEKYNLNETWLNTIEQHISKRAKEIIEFVENKE